jgi:hypothetical protein
MQGIWQRPFRLGLVALIAAMALMSPYAHADTTEPLREPAADHAGLQHELAAIRAATAGFHRLDAALAAGYELGYVNGSGVRIITGCIAHPTDGAMGYHYFNKQLIDDLVVDPLQPEGLVYAPGPNGQLRLVAVEYVVPGANSNPPGVSDPPSVFGMPMHILVPAVGFYTLHAWVWGHNPSGMFAHWNPEVVCP